MNGPAVLPGLGRAVRTGFVVPFFLALPLGGCALPPIVVLASYAADAVSYAATDKTVTDHVFSAVARSDCSFVRILKEKPICVDDPQQPSPVAVADAAPASETPPADATQTADATPRADAGARDTYVIIGSFAEPNNAERARVRYAEYHPVILQVTAHGRGFNRVVAGPMSHDEAAALKAKMTAATTARDAARG